MVNEGYRLDEIASTFGITRARVSQINSEYHDDVTDEAERDLALAQLDYLIHDVLYPLLRGPGKRLVSPSGRPVYEVKEGQTDNRGNPVFDFSRPIYDEYARVEVVNVFLKAQERRAKFSALDRAQPREKDESQEFTEMMNWVRTLAVQNKELRAKLSQYETEEFHEADVVSEEGELYSSSSSLISRVLQMIATASSITSAVHSPVAIMKGTSHRCQCRTALMLNPALIPPIPMISGMT